MWNEKTREVAREVSVLRPDLAGSDAIASVLTADPTLTAEEVIASLDEAAMELKRERAWEIATDWVHTYKADE